MELKWAFKTGLMVIEKDPERELNMLETNEERDSQHMFKG